MKIHVSVLESIKNESTGRSGKTSFGASLKVNKFNSISFLK